MKIKEPDAHLRLTKPVIRKAVDFLVTQLNLYGGNTKTIRLHQLITFYLLRPTARDKMNKVIDEYRKIPDYTVSAH